MKKYLVTGATGFIGNFLVEKLKKDRVYVRTISRSKSNSNDSIVCDFQKNCIPENIFENIDVVIHLFGVAHDTKGSLQKDLYTKLNTGVTINLATLAATKGVKRFIFISSVKAGSFSNLASCSDENYQATPEDDYGFSKRNAELSLLKIQKKLNMEVVIIRPALVYGPGAKGDLQLMLSGIERGWFPPLPETGNRRSMIHVDDLVRAILLVAEDKRANGEIFIATDGVPHSSREIYNAMCGVIGKPVPKWSVPKIFFDIASLMSPRIKYKINKLLGDECYSSTKLEVLGFKAKKSLKDMNETDF